MPAPIDLPRHPVFFGHPLHAILSDLPAALIPVALVSETARMLRPSSRTRFLSDAASIAALTAGLAAAAAGWLDWLTMPTEHPAQKPATLHGLINSGAVLSTLGAVMTPSRRIAWLGLATACVAVGGWIGGDLVFRLGWRVRPAEEAELVETKLREAGLGVYFDTARAEVDEFERRRTFTR